MSKPSEDAKTHERVGLVPGSPWLAEHLARYQLAAKTVQGPRVLDIACGTGVGAGLLTGAATCVVGTDIAVDAIETAARRVPERYVLLLSSGLALPFPDDCFTAVVSFETIEHVDDDLGFLRELHRVLTPGGTLLLSTPNALVTLPVDGVPRNPFHVREYTPTELSGLVGQVFPDHELMGQRTSREYGKVPYWAEHPAGPAGARDLVWKAIARVPDPSLAERLSRWLLRRSLYPGPLDWRFDVDNPSAGHVLVAKCVRTSSG
jgi:ubiquinone/menaquinone biosynthesis C-methylase UbiE